MRPIKTAIASFGMSGRVFHAPLLAANPSFDLTAVWERSKSLSKEIYPSIQICRSFEEILDSDVELVVVNTPNKTHFELAKAALLAGKHVVLEKPFTNTSDEGEELISVAKAKGLVLTVFHNRRWDSDFLTLYNILESGRLGRVVSFEAHYDRYRNFIQPDTWKEDIGPGSGILYNLGSHLVDQALSLFGTPVSVTARLGIQRTNGKCEDFFDIWLDYEDVSISLRSSYLVKEQGPKYILHGTTGSFTKYGFDPQEIALSKGENIDSMDWGKEPENFKGKLKWEENGQDYEERIDSQKGDYPAFYENVFGAIREGKPLAIKPTEALDVIRVIEACIASNEDGKRIVF